MGYENELDCFLNKNNHYKINIKILISSNPSNLVIFSLFLKTKSLLFFCTAHTQNV